jgi:flagellar biosynthesis protein FlhF
MNVKRFFSSSMQDALKMVREELGADAMILSNEKVDGGVEIVAALDYDEEQAQQSVGLGAPASPTKVARLHAQKHMKLQDELGRAKKHIEDVKRNQPTVANVGQADGENNRGGSVPAGWEQLTDMRAEIESLRGLIQQSVATPTIKPVDAPTALQEDVLARLESLCISKTLCHNLVAAVREEESPESAWLKVENEIERAIPIEHGEIIDQGGVIALVGPTGSGKTMTIGKMAARYVMKFGAESVALVTTDRYRIAAHEQLKVFGRILNVPVHSVDEQNTLDGILDRLSDKRLVLVDTAGLMPNDKCWAQQLKEIKMSAHRVQPYLVMSAVGQYQVMCANYNHYRMINPVGVILTKMDEAVSLGESISFLMECQLRVAYYTDGQRVPEDIHRLEPKGLLAQAEALLNSSQRWVTISSQEAESPSEAVFSHSA